MSLPCRCVTGSRPPPRGRSSRQRRRPAGSPAYPPTRAEQGSSGEKNNAKKSGAGARGLRPLGGPALPPDGFTHGRCEGAPVASVSSSAYKAPAWSARTRPSRTAPPRALEAHRRCSPSRVPANTAFPSRRSVRVTRGAMVVHVVGRGGRADSRSWGRYCTSEQADTGGGRPSGRGRGRGPFPGRQSVA